MAPMLKNNEKALLYLINKFGPLSRLKLVKIMFLISRDAALYDFVPYKYGPFSFQLYGDLGRLERSGYVTQSGNNVAFTGKEYLRPAETIYQAIDVYGDAFCRRSENELLNAIYDKYPEYTIFSDYQKRQKYERDEHGIVTIGYEGRSIDGFIYALIKAKVHTLLDVRNNPFSMKYGFSKSNLAKNLPELGIEYMHMPELGIKSEDRKNLATPQDYEKLFREYAARLKEQTCELDWITTLGNEKKVALMCFEKDPKYCHRGVIADNLIGRGVSVAHL